MLPAQKAENNRDQTQNNRAALTHEGHKAISGNKHEKNMITQKCKLGKLIPVSLFILTDLKLYRADGDFFPECSSSRSGGRESSAPGTRTNPCLKACFCLEKKSCFSTSSANFLLAAARYLAESVPPPQKKVFSLPHPHLLWFLQTTERLN